MATSMKKVEKPVTEISWNFRKPCSTLTRRRVFLRLKKWVSMTTKEMAEPMAVASPAP